jgi:hypothetical protein
VSSASLAPRWIYPRSQGSRQKDMCFDCSVDQNKVYYHRLSSEEKLSGKNTVSWKDQREDTRGKCPREPRIGVQQANATATALRCHKNFEICLENPLSDVCYVLRYHAVVRKGLWSLLPPPSRISPRSHRPSRKETAFDHSADPQKGYFHAVFTEE